MSEKTRAKGRSVKMSAQVKAAYGEVQGGVKSLGKAITEIQQGLRRAERKIEADARARIRALRQDAKAQLGTQGSRCARGVGVPGTRRASGKEKAKQRLSERWRKIN
jgi:hypothetical protein